MKQVHHLTATKQVERLSNGGGITALSYSVCCRSCLVERGEHVTTSGIFIEDTEKAAQFQAAFMLNFLGWGVDLDENGEPISHHCSKCVRTNERYVVDVDEMNDSLDLRRTKIIAPDKTTPKPLTF